MVNSLLLYSIFSFVLLYRIFKSKVCLMMYHLRRYDDACYTRNDEMFATRHPQETALGIAIIIGITSIICRRQTSLKKLQVKDLEFFLGTPCGNRPSATSSTCILSAWLTPSPLFAKNNPPDCFLTLRPSRVRFP